MVSFRSKTFLWLGWRLDWRTSLHLSSKREGFVEKRGEMEINLGTIAIDIDFHMLTCIVLWALGPTRLLV